MLLDRFAGIVTVSTSAYQARHSWDLTRLPMKSVQPESPVSSCKQRRNIVRLRTRYETEVGRIDVVINALDFLLSREYLAGLFSG